MGAPTMGGPSLEPPLMAARDRWIDLVQRAGLFAVWFGIIAGIIQLLGQGMQKFVLGDLVRAGPHVIWMTPLAETIVAFAVITPLLLVARRWPRAASVSAVTGLLGFVGVLSILLLPGWLHWLAALILAAGAAVQIARVAGRHEQPLTRIVRRTVPALLLVVAVLAVGLHQWLFWSERRAIAMLPAPAAGRPNVILIILDTVRARSLSLYGHVRPTSPHLEKIAADGTTFREAISPSSWTLPAHASLFTGRHHRELELGWVTPVSDEHPTLAEYLRGRGYLTGGFVANMLYTDAEDGLARGFIRYEDYLKSPGQIMNSSALVREVLKPFGVARRILGMHELPGRKDARQVNERFLRWADIADGRPYFAFLNYFDAHHPYLPEANVAARIGARPDDTTLLERIRLLRERDGVWDLTPAELTEEVLRYDATIAEVDEALGELIDALARREMLDNTILVVTSDHGEEFGEHGQFAHGNNLYRETVHVPLVVRFPPRVPARLWVDEPVSLRDLPATIVDLAGLREASPFPGRTWSHYWAGNGSGQLETVLSAVNPTLDRDSLMQLEVDGPWHRIRNLDGSEELYNVDRDPDQRTDLVMRSTPRR